MGLGYVNRRIKNLNKKSTIKLDLLKTILCKIILFFAFVRVSVKNKNLSFNYMRLLQQHLRMTDPDRRPKRSMPIAGFDLQSLFSPALALGQSE